MGAILMEYGVEKKMNNAHILKMLKRRANDGSGLAQIALGYAYYYGDLGLTKNIDEAANWFLRALQQNRLLVGTILEDCTRQILDRDLKGSDLSIDFSFSVS